MVRQPPRRRDVAVFRCLLLSKDHAVKLMQLPRGLPRGLTFYNPDRSTLHTQQHSRNASVYLVLAFSSASVSARRFARIPTCLALVRSSRSL